MVSVTYKISPNATPYQVIPDSSHRVKLTFRVDFSNGGYVYGEDFLLDIPGDSVDSLSAAEMIVSAMNLLRADAVTLLSVMVVRRGEHDDAPPKNLGSGLAP